MQRAAGMLLVAFLLAPSVGRAQECAQGQVRVAEGTCCWIGQIWLSDERTCSGQPICPEGMRTVGEACVAGEAEAVGRPACRAGMEPTTEGYCCWPAQVWSSAAGRCEGPPRCPTGMVGEGATCVTASSPVATDPAEHTPAAGERRAHRGAQGRETLTQLRLHVRTRPDPYVITLRRSGSRSLECQAPCTLEVHPGAFMVSASIPPIGAQPAQALVLQQLLTIDEDAVLQVRHLDRGGGRIAGGVLVVLGLVGVAAALLVGFLAPGDALLPGVLGGVAGGALLTGTIFIAASLPTTVVTLEPAPAR